MWREGLWRGGVVCAYVVVVDCVAVCADGVESEVMVEGERGCCGVCVGGEDGDDCADIGFGRLVEEFGDEFAADVLPLVVVVYIDGEFGGVFVCVSGSVRGEVCEGGDGVVVCGDEVGVVEFLEFLPFSDHGVFGGRGGVKGDGGVEDEVLVDAGDLGEVAEAGAADGDVVLAGHCIVHYTIIEN